MQSPNVIAGLCAAECDGQGFAGPECDGQGFAVSECDGQGYANPNEMGRALQGRM